MNCNLHLYYDTHIGEQLYITLRRADGAEKHYAMVSDDNHEWTAEVRIDTPAEYYYSVRRLTTEIRREWSAVAHRLPALTTKRAVCYDVWLDMPEDSYLYSSAFTDCFHHRNHMEREASASREYAVQTHTRSMGASVLLKVRAPQLREHESLWVTGDGEALGDWQTNKAVAMQEAAPGEWTALIGIEDAASALVFKFIIRHDDASRDVVWEDSDNRFINLPETQKDTTLCYELPAARFNRGAERFAGTAVPVFSLRTKGSFGVGDFGDLQLMTDWVALTGQRILQILPINDTTLTHTWTDSYPYSCISIFALHPMYCDLRQLPALADTKREAAFEALRTELNALPQIDYERVNAAKTERLRLAYAQDGKAVLSSEAFKTWFEAEQQWLVPYAQYSVLRDKNGTPDFSQWPDHNTWDEKERRQLCNPRSKAYKEVAFFYYVQYILAQQMTAAHEHARRQGVALKGDIPIGVNRQGCDVWQEPLYFNLDGQAGAPPDAFSANGQNWGFPTYNWEAMTADGCQWWVRRFQNMAKYFDAYRIDHVLGFFRIWEIPTHAVHGLMGQFQPALGLTVHEIEHYGLTWNERFLTTPFITDWVVDRLFGDTADTVRSIFLIHGEGDSYMLKPDFDTQRKVEAYFEQKAGGQPLSESDRNLRDTLYALISNVLFLRDKHDAKKFHPRISAQFDTCYETLADHDKTAYNALYNDYFYRRNNHFWYREAMKKLPSLVGATRMLVCAEDLGMVPSCVPWVMNELKILSLEIQNMPKEEGLRFGHLSHNPYRSVCTISSHDTATMRMWWDEDAGAVEEYYHTRLYHNDRAPHPMPGWLARDIIYRHLASPSMLCILTLQDWLATDETLRLSDANAERINIPANPHHYWRYRMHLNIDDLLTSEAFNHSLNGLIKETGR